MCEKCKIRIKSLINLIYFLLGYTLLEMFCNIPIIKDLKEIKAGTLEDNSMSVLMAILGFVFLIVISYQLIDNYKRYKKSINGTENYFCSVLNPFC